MRSYRPEELFDDAGALRAELAALPPAGERRMSANPHANGGLLLIDLELPDFRDYAVDVAAPAATTSEATRVLGAMAARRHLAPTPRRSGSWAPTRPPPTACRRCSRSPTGPGRPRRSTAMIISRPTGA